VEDMVGWYQRGYEMIRFALQDAGRRKIKGGVWLTRVQLEDGH